MAEAQPPIELTAWPANSKTKRESPNEGRTARDMSRRGRRNKARTINLHAERRNHGRGRSALDRAKAVSGGVSASSGARRCGRIDHEDGGHSISLSAGPALSWQRSSV